MYSEPTTCPGCGNRTLESSVYTDYCTSCDYGFYYPGVGEAVAGTLGEGSDAT
jgi:hypothetical protein